MIPRVAAPYTRKEIADMFDAFLKSYDEVIEDFKKIFCSKLGFRKVFLYNSGTAALYAVLKALNIEKKEVIIPAYTCGSVVEAVLLAGGEPVLVDVDLQTFNLSLTELEKAVNHNTKVVIPVCLFGNPIDYYAFRDIIEKYGIYVVEDAAQALGARYDGKYVGCFGDAAIFSFGLGKGVSGGGGGALVVNNDELINEIEDAWVYLKKPDVREDFSVIFKNFSMFIFSNKKLYKAIKPYVEKATFEADAKLVNRIFKLLSGEHKVKKRRINSFCKISKYSAALVSSQIIKLEKIVDHRRANAEYLKTKLNLDNAIIQKEPKMAKHAYSRFGLIVNDRDTLRQEIAHRGIDTEKMYSYMGKIYRKLAEHPLPNSYQLVDKLLCLPVHTKLNKKDLDLIVSCFNEIIGSRIL